MGNGTPPTGTGGTTPQPASGATGQLTKQDIIDAITAGLAQQPQRQAITPPGGGNQGAGGANFVGSAGVTTGDTKTLQKAGEIFGRIFNALGTTGTAALTAIQKSVQRNVDLSKDLQAQLSYLLDPRTGARAVLGNISYDIETNSMRMSGITKQYVEQYEEIFKSGATAIQDVGMAFSEGYGEQLDPMFNFFESAEAAAARYSGIMQEVISDTPRVAQAISDTEAKRMTFFAETLRLNERDVADFMKRQYAFTADASDEMLGQIGTVSKALSEETGISANQLKTGIVEVMKDVDKFGDIGVDSAGRISAALSQLGVDFQSFQALTDQFMNFDTAANKMGELATLFGVQMDAMEMTYLANEDQEEFLFRMREEILDAGIDIENMSKTRARALASQLGMSVTEMRTFLRDEELAVGQAGLEAATASAESMDALTVAGRDFGNEFARSTQDAAEMMQDKFKMQIIDSRNELMGLKQETNEFATAVGKIEFPDKFTEIRGSFTQLRKTVKDTTGEAMKLAANFANSTMDNIGDTLSVLSTGLDSLTSKITVFNETALSGPAGGGLSGDDIYGESPTTRLTQVESETSKQKAEQIAAQDRNTAAMNDLYNELLGLTDATKNQTKASEDQTKTLAGGLTLDTGYGNFVALDQL